MLLVFGAPCQLRLLAGQEHGRIPLADNPPWIQALADVRHMGPREGYCFHHVQAIMLSIDQYAEIALGNREYFLNKPHSIGGKGDKIP